MLQMLIKRGSIGQLPEVDYIDYWKDEQMKKVVTLHPHGAESR
jgi:hypothetical protein